MPLHVLFLPLGDLIHVFSYWACGGDREEVRTLPAEASGWSLGVSVGDEREEFADLVGIGLPVEHR